jgi:uncharacterized membrane protein YfcA
LEVFESGFPGIGKTAGKSSKHGQVPVTSSPFVLSIHEQGFLMTLTLFILGLLGGFLSGLLGLGGAVVMIPLMLAVPPLVGIGQLTMKEVAGLSMLQVLASSVSGILVHHKNNFVNGKVLLSVGIPMGLCALAGAYFSEYMENRTLLIFFGLLVFAAFIMLLIRKPAPADAPAEEFEFRLVPSLLIGAFVGFVSGAVGAGGGFILIPLMIIVLRVPLKVTVGTSLGIVFIGALTGSVGKLLSMQVHPASAIPLILGSIPAAQLGAKCSKAMKSGTIHRILLAVVLFSLVKTWWSVFTGGN